MARTMAMSAIEKLATDVRLIDLREVVSYTDYFVICTASNTRQTKAISDHIVEQMKERGYHKPRRREQDVDGAWLLLDYVDVVLHVFTPEARQFYRLESLWGQVPQEKITDGGSEPVEVTAEDSHETSSPAQA